MNLNAAAGLGSALGTAINLGGYRAFGGVSAAVFNAKVRGMPIAMGSFALLETGMAITDRDLDRAPVAKVVNPFIEDWFTRAQSRGERSTGTGMFEYYS